MLEWDGNVVFRKDEQRGVLEIVNISKVPDNA